VDMIDGRCECCHENYELDCEMHQASN
jgi:hypothetical protein